MKEQQTDVYQRVTDEIIQAIEAGTKRHELPWRISGEFSMSPINAATRKPYAGINILILWARSLKLGYTSGIWATYKQWSEIGAQVRRGEKASPIVFWSIVEKGRDDEANPETERRGRTFPFAREYHVFNREQVSGYIDVETSGPTTAERIDGADRFFQNLGVKIGDGMNSAFYDRQNDTVNMPRFESFKNPLAYYSVLSHETTHWTAAPHRLNRPLDRFGSPVYAFEELIAELGAAFLCTHLSLPTDPRSDHAPYIHSWLKALRDDKRAIFRAAAKAQAAVDWMKEMANVEQQAA